MCVMSTLFGDGRIGARRDIPLCEYPAWALEIMMGLYGPDTIRAAHRECAEQQAHTVEPTEHEPEPVFGGPVPSMATPQLSPYGVQLEAVNELTRFIERKLRRR